MRSWPFFGGAAAGFPAVMATSSFGVEVSWAGGFLGCRLNGERGEDWMASRTASATFAALERVKTGTWSATSPKPIRSCISFSMTLIITLALIESSISWQYFRVLSDAVFASKSSPSLIGGIFLMAEATFFLIPSNLSAARATCF